MIHFRGPAAGLTVLAIELLSVREVRGEKLNAVIVEQAGADKAAVASQGRIEELQDETAEMVGKYRQALADTESLGKCIEQLTAQVKSQAERMGEMQRQLREIETTQRDVLPLMQRMIETILDEQSTGLLAESVERKQEKRRVRA